MADTMRGLILTEKGHVLLGERPIPELGPLEALVRATCVATCNTDLEIVDDMNLPIAGGMIISSTIS
ncbi:MAG: NAD(P)-dependent alcohol dehydrogenase, partial [Actinobacteria bacterium]|nr:NAD(P)-dependent alcohol dehydrogenase [Actinomycetota bacterium]